ncbi:MAG: hypothetical protein Kow0070_17550 [Anaerolineales bacterium]
MQPLKTAFILLLGAWLILSTALVYAAVAEIGILRAVVGMGLGLIALWVLAGGTLMYALRERVKAFVLKVPLHWQLKFVLLATLLAMTEEAITTLMTNLAPLFGVQVGEAYITASANYFDVILHHSVIVFVPWFIAWAWLLKRYDFSPFWVFLLTGLNGLFAEAFTFGREHLSEFALWIFVYGLMVYLPAYTIPAERGAQRPKLRHGVLAFFLPLALGIPWAALVNLTFPNHPDLHFPPIPTE